MPSALAAVPPPRSGRRVPLASRTGVFDVPGNLCPRHTVNPALGWKYQHVRMRGCHDIGLRLFAHPGRLGERVRLVPGLAVHLDTAPPVLSTRLGGCPGIAPAPPPAPPTPALHETGALQHLKRPGQHVGAVNIAGPKITVLIHQTPILPLPVAATPAPPGHTNICQQSQPSLTNPPPADALQPCRPSQPGRR